MDEISSRGNHVADGDDTKHLIYPTTTTTTTTTPNKPPIRMEDALKMLGKAMDDGKETKNLLYPTTLDVDDSERKSTPRPFERESTAQDLIYPSADGHHVSTPLREYEPASQVQSLIYPEVDF